MLIGQATSDDESENSFDYNIRNQSKPQLNHASNQRESRTLPSAYRDETRNQYNRQINSNGHLNRDEHEIMKSDLKRLRKEKEEVSLQLKVIL